MISRGVKDLSVVMVSQQRGRYVKYKLEVRLGQDGRRMDFDASSACVFCIFARSRTVRNGICPLVHSVRPARRIAVVRLFSEMLVC